MKVLQIISSSKQSGAEVHFLNLSQALGARHEVVTVCPPGGWVTSQLKAQGQHPVELKLDPFNGSFRQLRQLCRREKIQVIHSHLTRATLYSALVGWRLGIPVVSTVHVQTHDLTFSKLMPRGKNRIVCVSKWVEDSLNVPKKYLRTVHNGTDLECLGIPAQSNLRAEHGIPNEAICAGILAKIGEFKGHYLLAEALPRVLEKCPNFYLFFAGTEHEPGAWDKALSLVADQEAKKHLIWVGSLDKVGDFLSQLDFTVLPSQYEACSMAIIESMACGVPVIATRAGGNPELISDLVDGMLTERNIEDLAAKITKMTCDNEFRKGLGKQAKRKAQAQFTLQRLSEDLEKIYQEVVG